MEIFIHEDLYNQIEIIPEENYFVINESQTKEGNIADNDYQDIPERTKHQMRLIDLKIPFKEILNIVLPLAQERVSIVKIGYGEYLKPLLNTEAFVFEKVALFIEYDSMELIKNICICSTILASKNVDAPNLPNILKILGDQYNLILVDWDQECIVRLKNRDTINRYLNDVFGFNIR